MIGKKTQDIQLTNHKWCPAAIKHWAAQGLGQGLWGDTFILPSAQWDKFRQRESLQCKGSVRMAMAKLLCLAGQE